MRSLRLKLAATAAAIAVVGALIPGISSAQTSEPFVATGLIHGSQTVFSDSLTELDFILSDCDVSLMVTQGLDAYVFELPAGFPADGAQALATGDSLIYDLDLAFYGADCVESGPRVGTDAIDETATLPAGTTFVIVKNFIGVQTNATLTVQPGTTPTPEPTPTGEPSPSPSPSPTEDTRVRGVYPEMPNDTYFGTPADDEVLGRLAGPTQWGMRKINAPQAWQEEQATGFKIKVAVVDTGVDLDHPDFDCADDNGNRDWKLNVVSDSAFEGTEAGPDDENGHGTHVAGIVGACTNNGNGVVGVAPDSTIIPVQVLDTEGSGSIENIALGVRRATDAGAHVINLSLGANAVGYTNGLSEETDEFLGFEVLDDALDYARDAGVVVVAAAGNDSLPLCGYPSLHDGVVCVGATDPRDNRSWYSTGPQKTTGEPTIVAPGGTGQVFCDIHAEEIFSTFSLEHDLCDEGAAGYRSLNGTSMATPHVTGVAALIYDRLGGVRSAANARSVIDALIAGAHDLGVPGADPIFGAGRVDALASVLAVQVVPHPEPPVNVTP